MNINNINGPQNIPGSTGNVAPSQQKTTEQSSSSVTPEKTGATNPARDTYASTGAQQFIDKMTDRTLAMDAEPRTELVDQARERVQSGFYETKDFYRNLAKKLTDSNPQEL